MWYNADESVMHCSIIIVYTVNHTCTVAHLHAIAIV